MFWETVSQRSVRNPLEMFTIKLLFTTGLQNMLRWGIDNDT